jgi:hypothetical protein
MTTLPYFRLPFISSARADSSKPACEAPIEHVQSQTRLFDVARRWLEMNIQKVRRQQHLAAAFFQSVINKIVFVNTKWESSK